MKIPVNVECDACHTQFYVFVDLADSTVNAKCTCGGMKSAVFDNGFTIGFKILLKSRYELLEQKDNALTIVFAASAVDCELSRLHNKRNRKRRG